MKCIVLYIINVNVSSFYIVLVKIESVSLQLIVLKLMWCYMVCVHVE